jgi:hypothetical protein
MSTLLLWILFLVGLVGSWGLSLLMWVFAISSQGFPKERIYLGPAVMLAAAVTGVALYAFGHPRLAAATVILAGPLLAFLVTLVSF